MSFVIVGNPGNRRVAMFQAALAGQAARVLPWRALAEPGAPARLLGELPDDVILRIDSMGEEDFALVFCPDNALPSYRPRPKLAGAPPGTPNPLVEAPTRLKLEHLQHLALPSIGANEEWERPRSFSCRAEPKPCAIEHAGRGIVPAVILRALISEGYPNAAYHPGTGVGTQSISVSRTNLL